MSDKESGKEKVAWKYIKQTDDDDDRRWAAAGASYDVILGPTSCSGIALMMWYFARVCVCVCAGRRAHRGMSTGRYVPYPERVLKKATARDPFPDSNFRRTGKK